MSIVPISHLSAQELLLLGNNVRSSIGRKRPSSLARRQRNLVAAVNRSLAVVVGERVRTLHRPLLTTS